MHDISIKIVRLSLKSFQEVTYQCGESHTFTHQYGDPYPYRAVMSELTAAPKHDETSH